MANQHTGSIEHLVQSRYSCSAHTWLEKAAKDGLSYNEASSALGLKPGTIRKWCGKFGLCLKSTPQNKTQELNNKRKLFYAKELNAHNFLSRAWHFA